MNVYTIIAVGILLCFAPDFSRANLAPWKWRDDGTVWTSAKNVLFMGNVPLTATAQLSRYIVSANRTSNCEIRVTVSEYLPTQSGPSFIWRHNFSIPTTSTQTMLYMKGNEPTTLYVWDPQTAVKNSFGSLVVSHKGQIASCVCDKFEGCNPEDGGKRIPSNRVRAANIRSGIFYVTPIKAFGETKVTTPEYFSLTESDTNGVHLNWGTRSTYGGSWEEGAPEWFHSFDATDMDEGLHIMCKNYKTASLHFLNMDDNEHLMVDERYDGIPSWKTQRYSTGPSDSAYVRAGKHSTTLSCFDVFAKSGTGEVMVFNTANETISYNIDSATVDTMINSDYTFFGLY
jgi:hypothetical protein